MSASGTALSFRGCSSTTANRTLRRRNRPSTANAFTVASTHARTSALPQRIAKVRPTRVPRDGGSAAVGREGEKSQSRLGRKRPGRAISPRAAGSRLRRQGEYGTSVQVWGLSRRARVVMSPSTAAAVLITMRK